jgi:putative ABC transport system substrate-binding protein
MPTPKMTGTAGLSPRFASPLQQIRLHLRAFHWQECPTCANTSALGARLPTMHGARDYVEAGGLMSYGTNLPDLFRRSADYVDKTLRGAKPGDLPVEQPTKFDLVLNLTTARALGLTMSPTLLARADEVIE